MRSGAGGQGEKGSIEAFRINWAQQSEAQSYHFTRGAPENQLQFAFQNHWRVFLRVLSDVSCGKVLEVGCGRGSMGAFFADAGFEVHLLDISVDALEIARSNFTADGLKGRYVCGDAFALPYASGAFDVVVSIGLLEHFAEIEQPLFEQMRVLRRRGVFLGYVVPERRISVQSLAVPVNFLLRVGYVIRGSLKPWRLAERCPAKVALYRNDYSAQHYVSILREFGVEETGSFGMFPVPLISHSIAFPFSLMAPSLEHALVRLWQVLLRPRENGRDPWICPERWGLAFVVWARK